MSLPVNQIVVGDCTEVMQAWPADSIDLVVTSPPYWSLRDYGSETVRIWGGDPGCEHEWMKTPPPRKRKEADIKNLDSKQATMRGSAYDAQEGNVCVKCGAWRGSLGLEPHPQLFIDHLVEICREIKRVLKSSGTFWLNLGDTYYGGGGSNPQPKAPIGLKALPKFLKTCEQCIKTFYGNHRQRFCSDSCGGVDNTKNEGWLQPKQKLMMPARVAIALQHDGWILRSDIIWHKPNHMPSSVKDRLTCAYEHVFLFAKARRYYFDLDAIRKPFALGTFLRIRQPNIANQPGGPKTLTLRGESPESGNASRPIDMAQELSRKIASGAITGKNPGDVWRVPTTPFPGAHFATFPRKLIEPIVKAGSPRWICSRCGKPRTRITEPTPAYAEQLGKSVHDHKDDLQRGMRYDKVLNAEYLTTGWSDCGCEAGWTPGVVLDPFGGSGTVGQVARRLGRSFILIEIIPEYCKMAEQRVRGRYKPTPKGVVPLDQIMEAEK